MEMPWDRRLRIMAEQEQAAEKAKQEREAAATASHLWTQAIGALQRSNPAPQPFPMPTCPVLIEKPGEIKRQYVDHRDRFLEACWEKSAELSPEAWDRVRYAQKEMNGGRLATASLIEKIRFNAYANAVRSLLRDPTKPGDMNRDGGEDG